MYIHSKETWSTENATETHSQTPVHPQKLKRDLCILKKKTILYTLKNNLDHSERSRSARHERQSQCARHLFCSPASFVSIFCCFKMHKRHSSAQAPPGLVSIFSSSINLHQRQSQCVWHLLWDSPHVRVSITIFIKCANSVYLRYCVYKMCGGIYLRGALSSARIYNQQCVSAWQLNAHTHVVDTMCRGIHLRNALSTVKIYSQQCVSALQMNAYTHAVYTVCLGIHLRSALSTVKIYSQQCVSAVQ